MDVLAVTRFGHMSPNKMRDLATRMRGLPVADAMKVVMFSARKGAFLLGKTLRSAIANATNNADLPLETLRVKEAAVEEGPRLRRYWPRARGGVSRIRKRLCHVRIVLTDGKEAGA